MLSGIDDPQMAKLQTFKGLVHRFRYFRGFAEFAFNSVPAAVMDEKKINLSTAMGGPEKFPSESASRCHRTIPSSSTGWRASCAPLTGACPVPP
jgi:hypothetical protein